MKFRQFKLIFIVISLLVLAGCGAGNQSGPVQTPFIGGTEGVIGVFENIGSVNSGGFPEVWEDQSFPVSVMLLNRGEYTVPSSTVALRIKGISQSDFTGITFDATNTEEIDKVSEYFPTGGEEQVFFGNAQYKGVVGTFFDANVFVEYDYPYETYVAVPRVCFKGDPRNNIICETDAGKAAFSSAGPIQIGGVVERSAGKGRIIVEIPVQNVGQGRAKVDDPGIAFHPIYDEVEMQIDSPGWECEARGNPNVVRMPREPSRLETVIRCKFGFDTPIAENDVFESQLDLTLRYVYQDFVQQTVRVRENPELE